MFEQRDLSFVYKYFTAEKQGSLAFIIIGSLAIILSIVFYFFIKTNPNFFRGFAIPLFAIGMLQLVASYTVYNRSDKQAKDVAYKIGMEPKRFVNSEELPRMKKVMKNFTIIKWIEITLLFAGLVLMLTFKQDPAKAFWYGFGIALAIQCAVTLTADIFAEKKGKKYIGEIEKLTT